ncbi:MAG: hypothetical protein PHG81_02650 [Aliarcobacter sp.]|nr:hypothetical protein [Aliarcobacter sp.]
MQQFGEDSYFFNVLDAIEEAKKNNFVKLGHPTIFGKQLCYYNADEKREDLPENCIFVPLENFYNFFYTTKYRLPTRVVVYNDDFSVGGSQILSNQLVKLLNLANTDRNKLIQLYFDENLNLNPDFNDEKLRIFIPSSRYTTVMQYISKGIYDVLKENDKYEVKMFLDETEFESMSDYLPLLVEYHNFNPHIVININQVLPFCNENVFNFIWFQDPMAFIMDKEEYKKKKREHFFSLTSFFDKCFERKKIPYERQNFAINEKIFKVNNEIKREDKIVFIGSSYNDIIKPYNLDQNMIEELKSQLEKGLSFNDNFIENILAKYYIDKDILIQKVIPYIVRDFSVIWLCESELSKKYKIEVYGWGWENYPEVSKFFKGALTYGEDLVNVYSSAKYTLAPHADYIIQQRVLEAVACGCQPILYDCREKDTAPYYEDVLIYYKSKDELLESFVDCNDEKFESFIKIFTYKNFAEKILNIVEKEKNE